MEIAINKIVSLPLKDVGRNDNQGVMADLLEYVNDLMINQTSFSYDSYSEMEYDYSTYALS